MTTLLSFMARALPGQFSTHSPSRLHRLWSMAIIILAISLPFLLFLDKLDVDAAGGLRAKIGDLPSKTWPRHFIRKLEPRLLGYLQSSLNIIHF